MFVVDVGFAGQTKASPALVLSRILFLLIGQTHRGFLLMASYEEACNLVNKTQGRTLKLADLDGSALIWSESNHCGCAR